MKRPDLFTQLTRVLPDADQHMAWIREVSRHGIRRPGTASNAQTQDWCTEVLEGFGLRVERQPVQCLTSHPGQASVTAWPSAEPGNRQTFEGFTMPFTTQTASQTFRLKAFDAQTEHQGSAQDAGLFHVNLLELPVSVLEEAVVARHDPSNEFGTHVHTVPFGAALGKEVDELISAGFGAMLGVFEAPWTSSDYFVPYDGVVRPIPGLWLDREQGATLDAMLAQGDVTVELTTTVGNRLTTDDNIIATAPSPRTDDWIVIGSHHDAPWASAVEDGSGIAQVLAQAQAWASLPVEDRPVSLAFLLTAAHMSDGAGTREFIRSWANINNVKLAVHLEHIAAEAEPDGAGGLRPTDRPEVRWWFASAPKAEDQEHLIESLSFAISEEDLDRSLVLPATLFGQMPPTDGGFFHLAEIPMVNLLSAPMYLFDPADTPDMVHQPSLVPTSRAAVRVVLDSLHPALSETDSCEVVDKP